MPNLRIRSPWCRSKILPVLHAVLLAGAATALHQDTCLGEFDQAYCGELLRQEPDFCGTNPNAERFCKVLCHLCPATVAPSTPPPSPACEDASVACPILVVEGCVNLNTRFLCRASCDNCPSASPTEAPTTSPTLMPTTSTPTTLPTTSTPTTLPTTLTPTTLVSTVSPTVSTTTVSTTLPTLPTVTPTQVVVAGASSNDSSAGVAADLVVGIIVAAVLLLVLGIAIGRWQGSTQQPGQQHAPQLVWRSQSRGGGAKDGSPARGNGGRTTTVENDNVKQGTGIDSAGYIDIGLDNTEMQEERPVSYLSVGSGTGASLNGATADGFGFTPGEPKAVQAARGTRDEIKPAFGFDSACDSPASRQSTGSVDLNIFNLGQSTSADPHRGPHNQDQDSGFNLWT